MKTKIKLTYTIAAIIVAVLLITSIMGGGARIARAAVPAPADFEYSDVLDDLQKDENFSCDDYPEISGDRTLKVIQIGESVNGELFIYVYQPSGETKNYTATTVRISTAINDNAKWIDYKLTLINSNGVFYKYKVEDLAVKADTVRYYDITAIHRKFDKNADEPTGNDNEINEVAFEVAQLWTSCTVNGKVSYRMETTEVITVREKHTGFARYLNGYKFKDTACDAHYIAFSTDRQIDELLEAEVGYKTRDYTIHFKWSGLECKPVRTDYGEIIEQPPVIIKSDQRASNSANSWLLGKSHTWQRIEKVEDFKANNNIPDELKKKLEGKEWMLWFVETSVSADPGLIPLSPEAHYTQVLEETILRLTFKTNGKIYNLGVVDNKQTEDLVPDFIPDLPEDFEGGVKIPNLIKNIGKDVVNSLPWWAWLAIGLGVIAIVLPILSAFVPAVAQILLAILKGLWWLICLPFKGIKALINKIRGE